MTAYEWQNNVVCLVKPDPESQESYTHAKEPKYKMNGASFVATPLWFGFLNVM